MKPLTRIERRYVAIWYIDIGNVAPADVPAYMADCKESLGNGQADPWVELSTTLEAPVAGYFVPVRGGGTHLEIQEFKFEVNIEEYDD